MKCSGAATVFAEPTGRFRNLASCAVTSVYTLARGSSASIRSASVTGPNCAAAVTTSLETATPPACDSMSCRSSARDLCMSTRWRCQRITRARTWHRSGRSDPCPGPPAQRRGRAAYKRGRLCASLISRTDVRVRRSCTGPRRPWGACAQLAPRTQIRRIPATSSSAPTVAPGRIQSAPAGRQPLAAAVSAASGGHPAVRPGRDAGTAVAESARPRPGHPSSRAATARGSVAAPVRCARIRDGHAGLPRSHRRPHDPSRPRLARFAPAGPSTQPPARSPSLLTQTAIPRSPAKATCASPPPCATAAL